MRKLSLIFILILIVTTTLTTPALADQKDKPALPSEGVMSSDPMFGSSEDIQADSAGVNAAGGLILDWGCNISNLGNGTVNIYGYTTTGVSVSSIKVTAYLQKWTGSEWVDVTGVTNSATNTSNVSASKNVSVSSGYYYRTRAVHYAANGTTTETTYSTSSYIYI